MRLLALALLITLSMPALAQNSCASLPAETREERDRKWYCTARAGNPGACASIFDATLRRLCKAETGRPNECASILDVEKRRYCEGVTGR